MSKCHSWGRGDKFSSYRQRGTSNLKCRSSKAWLARILGRYASQKCTPLTSTGWILALTNKGCKRDLKCRSSKARLERHVLAINWHATHLTDPDFSPLLISCWKSPLLISCWGVSELAQGYVSTPMSILPKCFRRAHAASGYATCKGLD